MRPATEDELLLAGWLERLVTLLRQAGGEPARLLRRVVQGRHAVLELDGARLRLRADAAGDAAVHIEPADADGAIHVRTRGDVLRDVMDGVALLDAVIADGRLDVCAPLADLLAFHELVLHALALGTREPGLRALWAAFDRRWHGAPARGLLLDGQVPGHGALRGAVPRSVQLARSPLFEAGRLS